MTNPPFGASKREGLWDEYIDKWVSIRVQGIPSSYGGKIVEIKDGYAYLSPFQDGNYDIDKGFVHRMNQKRALVPLMGSTIEPTTKKNIENYCEYHNKRNLEETKREKKVRKSKKQKSKK